MGFFRFRKSIKLAPGIRLNFGKSGVSASVGPRGFTTNIRSGRKARTTVGLPGAGVSYSYTHGDDEVSTPAPTPRSDGPGLGWLAILAALALLAWWII